METKYNRLVHDAVMSYDHRTSNGTFRYNVMTCFLPESTSSPQAIEAFMNGIFDIIGFEIDRSNIFWRDSLDGDGIETAIHDGLQFTARVDRFRKFIKLRELAGLPDIAEKPGSRWPAGPLRPGGPRTEDEKIAARLH